MQNRCELVAKSYINPLPTVQLVFVIHCKEETLTNKLQFVPVDLIFSE